MLCYSLRSFQYGLKAKKNTYKSMIFASKEGVVFEKMVESLLVMGAGAGAGEKKKPETVKNGPAPQHWHGVTF